MPRCATFSACYHRDKVSITASATKFGQWIRCPLPWDFLPGQKPLGQDSAVNYSPFPVSLCMWAVYMPTCITFSLSVYALAVGEIPARATGPVHTVGGEIEPEFFRAHASVVHDLQFQRAPARFSHRRNRVWKIQLYFFKVVLCLYVFIFIFFIFVLYCFPCVFV